MAGRGVGMSGLLFPKAPRKKRQKKHAKQSVVQPERDRHRCMLCMMIDRDYRERTGLQKHHVYMGPLRSMSEAEGVFVWLCPEHHKEAHKRPNQGLDLELKEQAQKYWESLYGGREAFIKAFGRSWL